MNFYDFRMAKYFSTKTAIEIPTRKQPVHESGYQLIIIITRMSATLCFVLPPMTTPNA